MPKLFLDKYAKFGDSWDGHKMSHKYVEQCRRTKFDRK